MPPFETGNVPEIVERVVVATHVGVPFDRAKVKPSVVLEIDDRVLADEV